MKTIAILNEKAGSLRDIDVATFQSQIEKTFSQNDHQISVRIVAPENLQENLAEAANGDHDCILACGGDGTIACAAGVCVDAGKYLGVLPGGTMNLFARSLGIPLDPEMAVEALATAELDRCDYATANGRLFLHQYSIGMQPAAVRRRSALNYNSRVGKIFASLRATLEMVTAPPIFQCSYIVDGEESQSELSMIAISNNLHTEGHLPYPDRLDGNILGVYSCPPVSTGAGAKLVSDLLLGNWSTNPDLVIQRGKLVQLKFTRYERKQKALLDGELVSLEQEVLIKSHGNGLKILRPRM